MMGGATKLGDLSSITLHVFSHWSSLQRRPLNTLPRMNTTSPHIYRKTFASNLISIVRLVVVASFVLIATRSQIPLVWLQSPVWAQTPSDVRYQGGTAADASVYRNVAYRYQSEESEGPSTESSDGKAALSEPISLTNVEAVAAEIKVVNEDSELDDTLRQRLLGVLKEIEQTVKNLRDSADEKEAYKKPLSRIGIDKGIAERGASREVQQPREVNRAILPIEQLKQYEAKASTNLTAAREAFQQAETAIVNRKQRLEKLPAEIGSLRRDLEALEASSVGEISDDPDGRLLRLRESLRENNIAATKQRLEALQAEQELLEAQVDLLPLRKTAKERNVQEADLEFKVWSTAIQKRRQSEIKKELSGYKKEISDAGGDPAGSQILKLEKKWVEIIGETDQTEQLLTREKSETDKWAERLAATETEVAEAKQSGERLSSSFGLQLQLMKNRLPSLTVINQRIDNIDEVIEQRRDLQRTLEMSLEGIDDSVAGELPMEVFSDQVILGNQRGRGSLPETEATLLLKFIKDLESYLNKLVDRRNELEGQRKVVSKLVGVIDSQIVWIRNDAVFRLRDINLSWQAFRWIIHPQHLKLLVARLTTGFLNRVELILISLVAFGVILAGGARLRRRMATHGERASSRQSTSLRPTFATMLLSVALVLPVALLLWIVGDALVASHGGEPIVRAVARAFHLAAGAVFPVELLRQWLRPHGLAIAHFETDEDSIRGLRRWLRILIDLGIPLLLVYTTSVNLGRYQLTLALSRIVLLMGSVLISVALWRMLEPRLGIFSVAIRDNPSGWLARLQHVWFLPIVFIPIAIAGIAVAGYGNAAGVLLRQLYWTFWLALIVFFVNGIMRRWMLTQRRRLAWAVHRERMEESQRLGGVAGMQGVEVEPTNTLEAAEINAQTSRLINTFLFIAALFGIAYIWSPVLPAIGYLESIQLWPIVDADGVKTYVTLADVVKAIPVLILTWASVRNLPGLIEAVLLERLPLEKPVRYAITTLGTYALLFVGLAVSAQTFGLRWDNIQWLVAALGVGLGFGLQEIFANFVSGLILLFEQPIRVGDIVTLGDTTGVVAKIRMRATTVTNWDRQELIIPNKDLITGRLVNWTLTDTTNRVVINVGVAYGSDTDQACDLLREICREHPLIKDDPGPLVTFEGFGDSTLDLVVRCYLADLDNRLGTIHELHTQINNRFNAAKIEIAFPQRDLNIRNLPPEVASMIGTAST